MKLSIITINYNNARGLERTIKSVICQTFTNYEYIIVDGGSTDGSLEVINKYADHISKWVSEPDEGIYNAMNKGTRMASGEYFNYMNSGDCLCDNHVLEDIFAKETNFDIITGCHLENGILNIGCNGITMLDLYKWAIDHQASFIKKELCIKHPYDERYRIVSDWKFFIESLIFDNCKFTFTERNVVKVQSGGISETELLLNKKERNMVLHELFPQRILEDYKCLAKVDPSLLKLALQLNKNVKTQNIVIKIANFMLWIKRMF